MPPNPIPLSFSPVSDLFPLFCRFVADGLVRLDAWLRDGSEEWMASLEADLRHVRQVGRRWGEGQARRRLPWWASPLEVALGVIERLEQEGEVRVWA